MFCLQYVLSLAHVFLSNASFLGGSFCIVSWVFFLVFVNIVKGFQYSDDKHCITETTSEAESERERVKEPGPKAHIKTKRGRRKEREIKREWRETGRLSKITYLDGGQHGSTG